LTLYRKKKPYNLREFEEMLKRFFGPDGVPESLRPPGPMAVAPASPPARGATVLCSSSIWMSLGGGCDATGRSTSL